MFAKRFEEVGSEDILRLVDEKIAERKTLEYKERLAIVTGDEKAEFLSDITSFANAAGGDLIYGISDQRDANSRATGIPDRIVGLDIASPAVECARIEQLVQTGVQPRLPVIQIKVIEVPGAGRVLHVRVGKSWLAPHMVTYANRSRFYSRNSSTGKMQLDVQQIGDAFAVRRGIGEQFRVWKTGRIAKVLADEGPVPMEGSRLLFHFVPAAPLTGEYSALPRKYEPQSWGAGYRLMSLSPDAARYNADGYLVVSQRTRESQLSYLQVFRDGCLEYGDTYALGSPGQAHVASQVFEEKIIKTFASALSLLNSLEVEPPIFVSLTLIGMKGRTMAMPQNWGNMYQFSDPFDREIILCPDMLVQNAGDVNLNETTLLPIVNAVWQASGTEETPYLGTRLWPAKVD
jgi:hypothetical protein